MRAGGVGEADALLELRDVEPPGDAVLAQRRDAALALGIGRAEGGIAGRGLDGGGRPVGVSGGGTGTCCRLLALTHLLSRATAGSA